MAVGLLLVALVMIAGGAYAAIEGYGIVLSERGWSMVIAGSVVATGGALLLGASLIAARLGRILREMTRLRDRLGRLAEEVPLPAPAEPADLVPTRPDPTLGEPAAQGDAPGGMTAAAAAARAGLSRRGATSPRVVGGPPEEPTVLAPGDAAAEPSRAPGAPTPVAANDGAPKSSGAGPSVVGTYNSGGNAYVMFSDGSIEADTPTGRYRFGSLDELKEFIANGGEEGLGATRAP